MILPSPTHSNYTNLLTDIERGQVKIPQFQRDFVWTMQKSAALLDSVIKGYPVGTFIFWSTKDRLRSVRDLGNTPLPEPKDGETVSFVLDGQQRLTSLYAALRGIKVERNSGKTDDFADMFINLDAGEDDQIVVTEVADLADGTWIRLRDLIHGSFKTLAAYPADYHERLSEYRRRIESYDFSIILVKDVPIDVATEIFTRINVGGKPLSVFEIMVAKTYDEPREFDLAEKFDELVARLEPLDYETVSDATLLQLVSLILTKECKKQTILKLGKADFIETWPRATDAFERAVEFFRNSYRIPVSQLLPYNTLLVPFAYFFFHHPDKPSAEQRPLLEDFFWRCSLGGRYSSSVESKLAQDVRRIDRILKDKSPDYDWAVDISPDFLLENGWFNAGRSSIKAILCLYAFHGPKSFNDDSIVSIRNYWLKQANSKNYHHFFPRAYLGKKNVEEWRINNILNITIVDDYLNKREIRAKPPATYMKTFKKSNKALATTMASHLIGDLDDFGVWENDYDTFLAERAKLVSEELGKRIISRQIDTDGQPSRDNDYEEEAVAFE
jgi:hypothetical protein